MGRVFSFDFEYPNYYMCKNCRTHIAAPADLNFTPQPGQCSSSFMTVINVEVSNPYLWMPGPVHMHNFSDIYCIKCGYNLGFKFKPTVSGEIVFGSDFHMQLEMGKFLWRMGDVIRNADTLTIIE